LLSAEAAKEGVGICSQPLKAQWRLAAPKRGSAPVCDQLCYAKPSSTLRRSAVVSLKKP